MTAAAAATARTHRTDAGWYLVGQLCLMVAAVLWGPFGARDASDVSDVLPALHPALFETPATVAHDQVETGERAGIVRATVAPAGQTWWPHTRRSPTTIARPADAAIPRRPVVCGPGACRAPPSRR